MPRRACDGFLCHVTVRCEHALWSGIRVKASGVFSEGLTKGRARCRSGCGLLWGLGPSSKHAHIDRYTQTNTGTQQHKQTHTGTQAHTETHRETQRHTQTHTGTQTDMHRHTETHTHRHLHTHTHTHTQTQGHAQTGTDTHAHTHRHTDTVRRAVGRSSPAVPRPDPCLSSAVGGGGFSSPSGASCTEPHHGRRFPLFPAGACLSGSSVTSLERAHRVRPGLPRVLSLLP